MIRKNYIYTNKKHSVYGIMSSFFGVLAAITYGLCFYKSYEVAGTEVSRLGVSALFATIFMIAGYVLAVISVLETEKFWFFRIAGFVFNTVALIGLSMILYAGAIL